MAHGCLSLPHMREASRNLCCSEFHTHLMGYHHGTIGPALFRLRAMQPGWDRLATDPKVPQFFIPTSLEQKKTLFPQVVRRDTEIDGSNHRLAKKNNRQSGNQVQETTSLMARLCCATFILKRFEQFLRSGATSRI